MSVQPAQPLGPADVFSRGFGLWWRNWRPMAAATLVVVVPMQVLNIAVIFAIFPGYLDMIKAYPKMFAAMQETMQKAASHPGSAQNLNAQMQAQMQSFYGPDQPSFSLLAVGELLIYLLAAVTIAMVMGAVLEIAGRSLAGAQANWREALSNAVGRVVGIGVMLVVAWILLGILAVVTFFLLGLPALWLLVAWIVAIPVLIFEDLRNFAALSRSFQLVRHRWWPTFGALILVTLVQMAVIIPLAVPYILGLFLGWNLTLTLVIATVTGLISTVITYPLLSTVLLSIYLDLRLRKDGTVPEPGPDGSITWRQVMATPPPAAPDLPST
ncbi:MAG: hypothetical protein QOG62_2720 [Thermoleophilaceae bacterium]|nr:hypothetical protein [Thermoleophilaceae bacterium]